MTYQYFYIALAIIKDAFLYRLRGMSSTPPVPAPANPTWVYRLVYASWWNDTLKRLTWSVFGPGLDCLFLAHAHGLPLWLAGVGVPLSFIAIAIGHSSVQGPKLWQNIGMGLTCACRLGAALAPFLYLGLAAAWYVLPLGMMAGVSYWLCYNTFENKGWTLRLWGVTWCTPAVAHQGTEWGELLTGGSAFGLPLSLAAIF